MDSFFVVVVTEAVAAVAAAVIINSNMVHHLQKCFTKYKLQYFNGTVSLLISIIGLDRMHC